MTDKELISRLERAAITSGLHVRVEATLFVAAVDALRDLSERVERAEAVLEAGGTSATAILATWNRARDAEQALTDLLEKARAVVSERRRYRGIIPIFDAIDVLADVLPEESEHE